MENGMVENMHTRLTLVPVLLETELKWLLVGGIQLVLPCQMARSLLCRDGMNMDATTD
jgi:hypothetical protein